MTLVDAWIEQHPEETRFQPEALRQWCAIGPSANDWVEWLSKAGPDLSMWAPSVFDILDQDSEGWSSFLEGAGRQQMYGPATLLDKMRTRDVPTGQQLLPLPVACLEALASTAATTNNQWKRQLLVRSPSYWFGPGQSMDPIGIKPLYELSVHLFQHTVMPPRHLPMLEWSPSSLYDDYGLAPAELHLTLRAIQHALEYAVYKHENFQHGDDKLAKAEMHDYFSRSGLDLPSFETMLDLTQNQHAIGNYISVLHCMLSPAPEQYYVDLGDDTPQP